MRACHITRASFYRTPYGALPASTELRIRVGLGELEGDVHSLELCYAYGVAAFEYGRQMMEAAERPADASLPGFRFYQTCVPLPDLACIFFYCFCVRFPDGRCSYIYQDTENPDGTRFSNRALHIITDKPQQDQAFGVTVYEPSFQVPEWYAGGVNYQIFPDRFARAAAFNPERDFVQSGDDERCFHRDWDEDVDYRSRRGGEYTACDFFGGSLRGIQEHLDQLQRFHVTSVYLNPIFHARSNHRYDTANYLEVDPQLGDETSFRELAEDAKSRGMALILDAVFSHTGADSIYFNKYKRFPSVGAWESATEGRPSPYFSWYQFHKEGWETRYESWWGFPELPSVHENDLRYRAFTLGRDGVVRTWLRRGAAGFRLDVSDELPDSFIRALRRSVRAEKADALVLGEVWENAVRKISYGHYRDHLFGRTHDGVMAYPFREALLRFFRGEENAVQLSARLETIREDYPPMAFAAQLNLLSSHDTPRFLTAVAGDADPGERSRQAGLRLSPEQLEKGRKRLLMAYAFALVYPGVPSIYYGDERLLEGYGDPFNRRTFPWTRGTGSIEQELELLTGIRMEHSVLRLGQIEWLRAEERFFCFRRYFKAGRDLLGHAGSGLPWATFAFNADENETRTLTLGDGTVLTLPPMSVLMESPEGKRLFRMDDSPFETRLSFER